MYRTALILLSFAFYSALYCHPAPKTNIEIFEQIISSGLDKYYYYPGVNRNNLFIVDIAGVNVRGERGISGSDFLWNIVKKTASQNKLNVSFLSDGVHYDSAYNLLVLGIPKLETEYSGFKKNTFLGSKTIMRKIAVNIALELKTSDGKVNLQDSINSSATDEVDYDKYQQLESSDYEFTVGKPPQLSALEQVFFPLLVICVTAAATILFFTIRSK